MIEILSYPRVSYISDDYEPGTRNPYLLHHLATVHAARVHADNLAKSQGDPAPAPAPWPFPGQVIPVDPQRPAPRSPDPEDAPL